MEFACNAYDEIERREALRLLRYVYRNLPPKHQHGLELWARHHVGGESQASIGHELGVHAATVSNRIHRTIRTLRRPPYRRILMNVYTPVGDSNPQTENPNIIEKNKMNTQQLQRANEITKKINSLHALCGRIRSKKVFLQSTTKAFTGEVLKEASNVLLESVRKQVDELQSEFEAL